MWYVLQDFELMTPLLDLQYNRFDAAVGRLITQCMPPV